MSVDEGEIRAKLLRLLDAQSFRALSRGAVSPRYNKLVHALNELAEIIAGGRSRGEKRKALSHALGSLLVEAKWPAKHVPLIVGPLSGAWAWAFRLGCFRTASESMAQGRSATVNRGKRFLGEKLTVEHALPVDVAPQLTAHLANLRLWPASLNAAKGAKVFAREARRAWRYLEIGLIDARACNLIQDARNRDRSVRRGRAPPPSGPRSLVARPVDPAELEARIRDIVDALQDALPYLESSVREYVRLHRHLVEQVSVQEALIVRSRHEAEDVGADVCRLQGQWRRLNERQKGLQVRLDALQEWRRTRRLAVDEALEQWHAELANAIAWREEASDVYHAAAERERQAEAALEGALKELRGQQSSAEADASAVVDECREEFDEAREELTAAEDDLEAAQERVATCERAVQLAEAAAARVADAQSALDDGGLSVERADAILIVITREGEALDRAAAELCLGGEEMMVRIAQSRNDMDEITVRSLGLQAQQVSCADLARKFAVDIDERLDALRRFNIAHNR
jgi:hypothetical protein